MDVETPARFEAVPVTTPADGPLAVELVPAPDPWDVARRLAHLSDLLFLDSADRHGERGRYSYVAALTDRTFTDYDGPILSPGTLLTVEAFMRGCRSVRTIPGLPPFQGGFAGYFGYEWGRHFERIPSPRADEFGVPSLHLGIYNWVVSFDRAQRRAWVVSAGYPMLPSDLQRSQAESDLRYVCDLLAGPVQPPRPPERHDDFDMPAGDLAPQYPLPGFPGVTSNFDRAGYEAAVARVVEYIRAGDCYQVNLSQRLLAPLREHPLDLYGRLRRLNPAPFAAYFDLGEFQVLSASPERFLRVENGEVETRPIKGTRPRGRTPAEDAALITDLASSAKDRAENVMIVDLLRNDLGRVCEFGSVRVPRVCEVETFRYVHHLVSEVRGKLRPECSPLDLLRAAFPGGSVTGAPKVRAMEIIAELEPTARGPYCGSLGFIGFDGTMDTNILIRTFTAGRGWVQFPVGGGIVADSDPRREYEETLHKAAGLLKALEL
jgi:para-aminobenzoate synthetase component 1